MANAPTPNPNVPSITQQPTPDPGALAYLMRPIIQGLRSLAGQTGGPLDRAATWSDLVRLGVASEAALQSSQGQSQIAPAATTLSLTSAGLASETTARIAGDQTNATAIAAETSRAETAEAAIVASLAGTATSAGLAAETTARMAADTSLATNLAAEAATRGGADTTLTTNLATEVATRASADTILQNNINALPHKFAGNIGDGTTLIYPVAHNLGRQDVLTQVFLSASPFTQVACSVANTDANHVTVTFASAPAANAARVIVIG
jgi:hypothetical protein